MSQYALDANVSALAAAFGNDIGGLQNSVSGLAGNARKNNFAAERAPLPTDDETEGYSAGSRWLWQGQEWLLTETGWVPASIAPHASRAELVAWVAAGNIPIDGREYRADGLTYLGSAGATYIGDLPGLVPGSDVSAYHFGGIGDGASHPLSDDFATLTAARVAYPFATSLDNETDRCALQAAANYALVSHCDVMFEGFNMFADAPIEIPYGASGGFFGSSQTSLVITATFDGPDRAVIENNSRTFAVSGYTIDCGATATTGQATCPMGVWDKNRKLVEQEASLGKVVNCRNFAHVYNQFYDAKAEALAAFDCGWTFQHRNLFKLFTFTATSGGNTISASGSAFTADDVGKQVCLAKSATAGQGGGFVTTISAVAGDGTSATVSTAIPFNYSSNRLFFQPVTASGSDGSTSVTLSDEGEFNLAGRYIVLGSKTKVNWYKVATHVGTTVTLETPLVGDVASADVVTGAAVHFIDGNGGRLEIDCEGLLGPAVTGRIDWVDIKCKVQSLSTSTPYHVYGGFGKIYGNATGVVMPVLQLSGEGPMTLNMDNIFDVFGTSEKLNLLYLHKNDQYPRINLTLPLNLRAGYSLLPPGNGDSRNVILHWRGTTNGFADAPSYYKRAVSTKIAAVPFSGSFTEIKTLVDLSPGFILSGTVLSQNVPATEIYALRIALQNLVFTGSDASNHYAIRITSDPRGLVSVTEFALYSGAPNISVTSSPAFSVIDCAIASPISSRAKSNALFIGIKKIGSPPTITSTIGEGLCTVAYDFV